MTHTLLYTLFPTATILIGTLITLITKPKGLFIPVIQALAAGVLLAGIATELLPKLDFHHYSFSLTLSFLVGLLLMLGLSQLNPGCCGSTKNKPLTPFVTAFALEFFINGVTITLSGTVSPIAGFLVGISMGICCFVCGTSVAVRFHSQGFSHFRNIASMTLLALLPVVGGVVTLGLLKQMPPIFTSDIIAFGIAVLLYIATADLLLGAFKNENNWVKISFFLGFILIPILGAHIG